MSGIFETKIFIFRAEYLPNLDIPKAHVHIFEMPSQQEHQEIYFLYSLFPSKKTIFIFSCKTLDFTTSSLPLRVRLLSCFTGNVEYVILRKCLWK